MTWESSMDNWHLYGLWWQHGPWKSFQAAQLRKWTNLHFKHSVIAQASAIVWLDLKFSTRACTSFCWPYSTGTWSCTSSASLPHLSPGGGGGGCCCCCLLLLFDWLVFGFVCLGFCFWFFFVCFFLKELYMQILIAMNHWSGSRLWFLKHHKYWIIIEIHLGYPVFWPESEWCCG